jgi:hypothetical protein
MSELHNRPCPYSPALLSRTSTGIGVAALAALSTDGYAAMPGLPHFPPKAKRVIFLHQSGGPSQMDLFDPKPKLDKLRGKELPGEVRMGQRITGMTSGQRFCRPPLFKFQHTASRAPG